MKGGKDNSIIFYETNIQLLFQFFYTNYNRMIIPVFTQLKVISQKLVIVYVYKN